MHENRQNEKSPPLFTKNEGIKDVKNLHIPLCGI